jgi:hypothetical protein
VDRQNHNDETITAELMCLGGEITARGYHAALATPVTKRPRLQVANPALPSRASVITADSGWYWWPDARRLGVTASPGAAARMVIHVLHLGCDCHE